MNFLRQFIFTLALHKTAVEFIREQKPWRGLAQYGWLLLIISGIGVWLSWRFFSQFFHLLEVAVTDANAFGASMNGFVSDLSWEKVEWAFFGGKKYLVIIALELFVFHFIQKTLHIRIGRPMDTSMKAFIAAEWRIVVVSIVAWILETIVRGALGLGLGIFGLDALKQTLGFLVQCYFLGWMLVDNYNECFHLKVSESARATRQVAGVALATGMVAYALMFLPLVGVVASAILGGVTATLAMERFVTPAELQAFRKPIGKQPISK